jgi:hypothetical protein
MNILETYRDRLARIVDDGYDILSQKTYGAPLILGNSYEFKWDIFDDKYFFMKLEVPKRE